MSLPSEEICLFYGQALKKYDNNQFLLTISRREEGIFPTCEEIKKMRGGM